MWKVLNIIRNPMYWQFVKLLGALIEPIAKVQRLSEADRTHVGRVLPGWRSILDEWNELARRPAFAAIDFAILRSMHSKRM